MGKHRIVAETGAGQHGVATATACALLGLECHVYMGAEDMDRQALNVFRIRLLGAEVCRVDAGSRTLKDAINEAMRDWVTNVATRIICLARCSARIHMLMVREFLSVIGREARSQIVELAGRLPDAIVACVGGGSNAIGMFDGSSTIGKSSSASRSRAMGRFRRQRRRAAPLTRTRRQPFQLTRCDLKGSSYARVTGATRSRRSVRGGVRAVHPAMSVLAPR